MYTTAGLNVHNNNRSIDFMLGLGVRQLALCETNNSQDHLERAADRHRYRLTNLAHPGADRRRKPLWDNTVLTKMSIPSEGSLVMKASERAQPYRIAMERTIVAELTDDPDLGPMARISLHPNYIGAAHDQPNNRRVAETDNLGITLDRMLDMIKASYTNTIVASADVNIGRNVPTPGWLSVWEVFDRHGLIARPYGEIDSAFHTRNLKVVNFKVISARANHSDHPAFKCGFVPAKPKRKRKRVLI